MSTEHHHAPLSRARRRALQALYQWHLNPSPAAEIIAQFAAAQDFAGVDKPHFTELVSGVTGGAATLDKALQALLDRPLAQIDPLERTILRLAAYELLHCPAIPARVVINEAVDLAHRFGATAGHAYVNAVTDRLARQARAAEFDTP